MQLTNVNENAVAVKEARSIRDSMCDLHDIANTIYDEVHEITVFITGNENDDVQLPPSPDCLADDLEYLAKKLRVIDYFLRSAIMRLKG